jgi:hypothetical protein
MNVLFILTSSLFFLWIIRDIFFWLTVWQQNEYRPDRFFASLKRKKLKSQIIFSPVFIPRLIIFGLFIFVVLNDDYLTYYQYIVAGLYFVQAFILGYEIYRNSLKKPRLTLQAILIIILTFASVVILFSVPLLNTFFWLLLIDLSISLQVALFVFLFSFPSEIYSDWQLQKAIKKMQANPDLLVIAVTGSQGKSLTTDYITYILRERFKVIKTHRANNTYGEISRTILSRLESDTEIFVAEIKAYKRGEIGYLCEFLKPKIGVLTPITNQYLSLFKNLDTIIKTNHELLESLPKDGLCLFDGSNKNTYSLYRKTRKRKASYGGTKGTFDISVQNVVQKAKKTSFDVQLKGKIMHFVLNSHHPIEHLLPGIYIADYLGMKEREIKRAVAALK